MKEEGKTKKKISFWKTVKVVGIVAIGVAAGVILQKKFDVAGVVGKMASKKKDASPKVETKPATTATPTYSNNNGWNKNRRYYRYNNNNNN